MKKLIVLEGCDGSGKSSCAIELARQINGIYYKTPPEIFESLRETVEETRDYNLRFYYYLSSVIYASNEIKKILKYSHVVCDRYIYSTIAYHRALGVSVSDNLSQTVVQANHSFCLYAKESEIIKRMEKRKRLGVFDKNFNFQRKVFQELSKLPFSCFIDTSGLKVQDSVKKLLQKTHLKIDS